MLDLDYCILDTGLWKEANFVAERESPWLLLRDNGLPTLTSQSADFARPYLHEFLRAISPYYDIVIWRLVEEEARWKSSEF